MATSLAAEARNKDQFLSWCWRALRAKATNTCHTLTFGEGDGKRVGYRRVGSAATLANDEDGNQIRDGTMKVWHLMKFPFLI